ncbi:MAG: host specificity factor TipJ family phage tail protein [Xanthobacteraceae bacterium]
MAAVIGLSLLALGIGAAVGGSLFGLALGGAGTTIASLIGAGVVLGGSLLVNTLIASKPATQTEAPVDQIYSASACGNVVRLMQPIKLSYGTIKTFPDLAAQPWSEFGAPPIAAGNAKAVDANQDKTGNDQYLNVLLLVGLGKYTDISIFDDDTPFWDETGGLSEDFSDAQVQLCGPGEAVTLFPTNVVQAVEASGQEFGDPATAPNDGWIGGFIFNASGTLADAIACDLAFPEGVYWQDTNGVHAWSVPLIAEYRPVNDAGAPLADYATLWRQDITYATRTPQRVTIKTTVTPGRYQVRMRRLNAPHLEAFNGNGFDTAIWAGLRGFLQGSSTFHGVTTIAIRVRANSQLSALGGLRFAVKRTRILPVWDDGIGDFVEQPTQNPFWAFYDAAVNEDYGAGRSTSKIDLAWIIDQAAAADARGDTFNYEFAGEVLAPQAFDTILASARCKHRWSGDVLTGARDEWRAVPQMLLTDREIVRDSVKIALDFNTEDQADAVVLEYLDEETWGAATIQYPPDDPPTFVAVNPARRRIDGVTNRAHAQREVAFLWRQAQLRRSNITLDTEHDGRMLGLLSHVGIQTELPRTWGQGGRVAAVDDRTLTLDPAPVWTVGPQHYIAIRSKTGAQFGPVRVARGDDDSLAVLDATDLTDVETAQNMTLAQALDRLDGAEDPSFAFGVALVRGIVLSGRPNGERVSLVMAIDSAAVHDDGDLGEPESRPMVPTPRDDRAPVVTGIEANFLQGVAEPVLAASWPPVPGATLYLAQISQDEGASWTQVHRGSVTRLSVVVDLSPTRLRIAAIGSRQGPWVAVDVEPPTIVIKDDFLDVGLAGFNSSVLDYLIRQIPALQSQLRTFQQLIASVAAEQDADNWLDKQENRRLLTLTRDNLSASIEEVSTVALATEAAFAAYQVTVNAHLGDLDASVATNATAIAAGDSTFSSYQTTVNAHLGTLDSSVTTNAAAIVAVDGKLAATYQAVLDVDGYISGWRFYNDGSSASLAFMTDSLLIGHSTLNGGTPVPMFSLTTISGTVVGVLNGNLYVQKLVAGAIDAGDIIVNDIIVTGHLTANSVTSVVTSTHADIVTSDADGSYHDLTSLSITIADGTQGTLVNASCQADSWNGSVLAFINTVYTNMLGHTLSIWLDGVKQRELELFPHYFGGSGFSATWAWYHNPALSVLLSGLSAGSHTIAFRYKTGTGFTGLSPINYKNILLTAQEARR